MAVVKIWKVKSDLKQVVNYVEDKDKTRTNDFKDLDDLIRYTKDGDKTENSLYVTGINCNPRNGVKDMIRVKKRFKKEGGVLAWHAYQSFKEGEVTPKEAHEIGIELANEMWGREFQVIVTTHLNTKHYHNHFVVNSVSFVDGKKYNANRYSYAELRRLNDSICMEHGKSYLEEKNTKSGLNYVNYQNAGMKYSPYYKRAKENLDLAINRSRNYKEFLRVLNHLGYITINRSGKLSIREKGFKKNIRIERYFGNDYSIENIRKRIYKHSFSNRKSRNNNLVSILLRPKYNSFASLYVRYTNILRNYSDYINKCSIPSSLKEDVKKLDMFNKQTILLVNNGIETEEMFLDFFHKKVEELSLLRQEKEDLWKKSKTLDDHGKKEVRNIIDRKLNKIKVLSEEVRLCENIKMHHNTIEENIKHLERGEMILNEHIR